MKILIVEDEKGLREALIRTLTGEGYLADDADLEEFRKRYGIDGDIETVY